MDTGGGRRSEDDALAVGEDLGHLLGVAHRLVRSRWEQDLEPLGLTAPQAAVLTLVAGDPDLGVVDVARRLRTDAMNAHRVLGRLVARGLVERRPHPRDGRRQQTWPTPAGAELAAEVGRRRERHRRAMRETLGSGHDALLVEVRRLVERLDESPATG